MVIVVSGCILEKAMILPFSKLIIKDSGSNVRHKFFMILKKSALSLFTFPQKLNKQMRDADMSYM